MSVADALTAGEAGADAIGLVFADSARQVTEPAAREIAAAVAPFVSVVGVFLDQPPEYVDQIASSVPLDVVQLHGDEPREACERICRRVVKRVRVDDGDDAASLRRRIAPYEACAILLDPGAGSGRTFDWTIASGLERPLIISGGLNPQNVRNVIAQLRPAGVDVSSGVECEPGRKDAALVRRFIENVRDEDARFAAR